MKIAKINDQIQAQLLTKIDQKTKPVGALGLLEKIAFQIGCIQETTTPTLEKPTIMIFAGDHGIAKEGVVNLYPQEVTWQMVFNFLNKGAAINVFAQQHHIALKVIDAGVNFEFETHPDLIDAKIGMGTQNYLYHPAMSVEDCESAMKKGAKLVQEIHNQGTNVLGFGEMGIGNTSSASLLMNVFTNISLEECVGKGTGLEDERVKTKLEVLSQVVNKHGKKHSPISALATFGGFEIAMMVGAMLEAAHLKMTLLIDGFIVSSALLVASKMEKNILEYCVFCHTSNEKGHQKLVKYLKGSPILNVGMRLGEGTGVAVAYPIIQSSVDFLNKMASFESASVSQK